MLIWQKIFQDTTSCNVARNGPNKDLNIWTIHSEAKLDFWFESNHLNKDWLKSFEIPKVDGGFINEPFSYQALGLEPNKSLPIMTQWLREPRTQVTIGRWKERKIGTLREGRQAHFTGHKGTKAVSPHVRSFLGIPSYIIAVPLHVTVLCCSVYLRKGLCTRTFCNIVINILKASYFRIPPQLKRYTAIHFLLLDRLTGMRICPRHPHKRRWQGKIYDLGPTSADDHLSALSRFWCQNTKDARFRSEATYAHKHV